MSIATADALDAAINAHIADETDGDLCVGWVLAAGIVTHDMDEKTSFVSSRHIARHEARGLLLEAGDLLRLTIKGD